MTDIDKVAEAIADTDKSFFYLQSDAGKAHYRLMAKAAIDALQLTQQTREEAALDDITLSEAYDKPASRLIGPWEAL